MGACAVKKVVLYQQSVPCPGGGAHTEEFILSDEEQIVDVAWGFGQCVITIAVEQEAQ